jgi:hypothetical protein
LVTIETSSFGDQYYYYFYDWSIEQVPTTCEGSPVAVTVTLEDATSINDFDIVLQYLIYLIEIICVKSKPLLRYSLTGHNF